MSHVRPKPLWIAILLLVLASFILIFEKQLHNLFDGSPWIVVPTMLGYAAWLVQTAKMKIAQGNARVIADRRRCGLCLECGYDLRGTTDRCRCPECGESFEVYASCKITSSASVIRIGKS